MLPDRRERGSAAEIVGSSRIAVLVPCYNEEAAIGKVVADFRAALPEAAHLRLRQQFDRPHRRGRRAGRRRGAARAAPGQGQRGAAHVRRRRRRHLRAGRRRRDLRRAERARHDRASWWTSGSTWWCAVARRSRGGGLPAGPPRRQPAADRLRRPRVRPVLHRHAVGLPGVLAALREVVSGAVGRLRDRDRADRPRARARTAGRRGARRRIIRGRRARPPSSAPGATAIRILRTDRCGSIAPSGRCRSSPASASRSAIVVDRPRDPDLRDLSAGGHWCRGCRPRCCRPA